MNRVSLGKPVICVVGPTASGKSALAQRIAIQLDGEVVSADSMQIYSGMDIGTGKLRDDERIVKHHCMDLLNPGEPYSVALFQRDARLAIEDIDSRGKRALLCGGTGFYVRAAIDDYDFPEGEQKENPIREHYMAIAEAEGARALWLRLRRVDSRSAAIIPENDVKRLVRAFELLEADTTYARQKEALQHIEQCVPACFIGLKVDVEILAKRIDARVDAMVEEGLLDEVHALLDQGFREGITAPQAIGYKEIVAYIDGESTFDEAIDSIKRATRRYAKRQRTWFRKDKRIRWIEASELNLDDMTGQALDYIATIDGVSERGRP